jgi:predicted DNA-binding transcriptional regulator AlpA
METEIDPKLFTKPRIGRRYEVSQRTIDNWMKHGFPHVKIGRKFVRFDPDECDAYIARFKVKAKI